LISNEVLERRIQGLGAEDLIFTDQEYVRLDANTVMMRVSDKNFKTDKNGRKSLLSSDN
jgi:hypothetical protein